MYPITDSFPKHLLPIANKPLMGYILENLERYHAYEIIVVANESSEAELREYVENRYQKLHSDTKIKFYVPEYYMPVVDLIPIMHNDGVITRDFIIYGGDIITDINLYDLLDFHFTNQSHMTPVLLKPKDGVRKKGGLFSTSDPQEYVVYALEEGTDRLVNAVLSFDMARGIPLKTCNLVKHPRIYFQSTLDEANIIVFSKNVVHLFDKFGPEFGTVTQDFIPFLIQNQYNSHLVDRFNGITEKESNKSQEEDVDTYVDIRLEGETMESLRPFAYITDEYCIKINSSGDFHEANIASATNGKPKTLNCFISTQNDPPRTEIIEEEESENTEDKSNKKNNKGKDKKGGKKKKAKIAMNVLGDNTSIGENSMVQRSVIGENVTIGKNCKIVNCVIFNDTSIEDKVTLQNCVIGLESFVKSKSVLKEVIVNHKGNVQSGTNLTKETVF